ncbi:hypothetical protein [Rhizobium terricola]|uniref:hypothetical protein n=1 Tax=Rhizobium terricola TaxID=2728849 RepID=UPI001FEEC423|nr:hypothetical protein [Rhizobium terricola]
MMKQIATGLLAATVTVIAVSEANAWNRNRTVTTNRGTHSLSASGSCANNTCTRNATRTGVYGGTATRSGSVTCDPASNSCSGSRTTTGPNGGTIYREGEVHW